jgi:Transposase IS66 family.
LETAPIQIVRRQVYDIPLPSSHITEYQSEVKKCPHCSRTISPAFPDGVMHTINFGPHLKTLALYLHSELFTPYAKIVHLIHDFYDLKLSPATIEKFIFAASNALDSYEHEIRTNLLTSPILHADETGFRVEGKRWWLHSLSNGKVTYYGVHPNRGSKAIESMNIYRNIPVFSCMIFGMHMQNTRVTMRTVMPILSGNFKEFMMDLDKNGQKR